MMMSPAEGRKLRIVATSCFLLLAASIPALPDARIQAELEHEDARAGSGAFDLDCRFVSNDRDERVHYSAQWVKDKFVGSQTSDKIDLVEWNEGKWRLSQVGENTVQLTSPDASDTWKRDPLNSTDAIGPHFGQGRGLSACTDIETQASTAGVEFKGKYRAYDVRAVLDPAKGLVAKEIDLFPAGGSKPFCTFTNTDLRQDENGYWFASRSVKAMNTMRWDLAYRDVSTTPPTLEQRKWLWPGSLVSEHRVDPGIGYKYDRLMSLTQGVTPSLDELYRISLTERGKLDSLKTQDRERIEKGEARRRSERLLRMAGVIGAALISLLGLLFARRLLRTA
jgi:hypothetical protein